MDRHELVDHERISRIGVHVLDSYFYDKEMNQYGEKFIRCPKMGVKNSVAVIRDGYCSFCDTRLEGPTMLIPMYEDSIEAMWDRLTKRFCIIILALVTIMLIGQIIRIFMPTIKDILSFLGG